MSKSILEKADIGAANVDCFCILPEKRIVDDSIFSWVAGFEEAVSTEFFDYEKENSGIENPVKREAATPMSRNRSLQLTH